MKTTHAHKKLWPKGKPLPSFKSHEDEVQFWLTYEVQHDESDWEEVVYEPHATRHPRTHVYRVRLDDHEMGTLQALAKRKGVTASTVLRELLRQAVPEKKRRKAG
jgi:hypothetical protein